MTCGRAWCMHLDRATGLHCDRKRIGRQELPAGVCVVPRARIRAPLSEAVRFFFSSRRRHTRCSRDWSSDVCSSDLGRGVGSSGNAEACLYPSCVFTRRSSCKSRESVAWVTRIFCAANRRRSSSWLPMRSPVTSRRICPWRNVFPVFIATPAYLCIRLYKYAGVAMNTGKTFRQGQILRLVTGERIGNQEELRRRLAAQKMRVTQATLSRDLQELRLEDARGIQEIGRAHV